MNTTSGFSSSESISENNQQPNNTTKISEYSSNLLASQQQNKSVENLKSLNSSSLRGIYGGGMNASHRSASLNDLIEDDASERVQIDRQDENLKTATFRLKPDKNLAVKAKMVQNGAKAENQLASKSINNFLIINERINTSFQSHETQEPFYLPSNRLFQKAEKETAATGNSMSSSGTNNCASNANSSQRADSPKPFSCPSKTNVNVRDGKSLFNRKQI